MTPRASAGTVASSRGEGTTLPESRGRGKSKGKPDPEDLHLRNPARRPVVR